MNVNKTLTVLYKLDPFFKKSNGKKLKLFKAWKEKLSSTLEPLDFTQVKKRTASNSSLDKLSKSLLSKTSIESLKKDFKR